MEEKEKKEFSEAERNARTKILIKCAGYFIICIVVAILFFSITKADSMLWIVPALISLLPLGLGVYYILMFRFNRITATKATLISKRRDFVNSFIKESSISGRKKYIFEYNDEEGAKQIFDISRGTHMTGLEIGRIYVVLHRKGSPPGAENFLEFSPMGYDETLIRTEKAAEPKKMFGRKG